MSRPALFVARYKCKNCILPDDKSHIEIFHSDPFLKVPNCAWCEHPLILVDAVPTENNLFLALKRLLNKMPKPPGCETENDVGDWLAAELKDAGVPVIWRNYSDRNRAGYFLMTR